MNYFRDDTFWVLKEVGNVRVYEISSLTTLGRNFRTISKSGGVAKKGGSFRERGGRKKGGVATVGGGSQTKECCNFAMFMQNAQIPNET